ncbi:MAG TPA: hypothetical protein VF158_16750 [Longimicrobiales bacterium]
MLTLHRLSLGYRLLYTGVLVFMTAGTAAHALHQHARAGIAPSDIAAWYRGNADDPNATLLLFPRSFEEVLGDASLALTSYALALAIFGAILYRSEARPGVRAALVGSYGAAGIIAASAPLLVRYASAAFAWLDAAALLALPVFALAMTVVAMHDMWRRRDSGLRLDPRPV